MFLGGKRWLQLISSITVVFSFYTPTIVLAREEYAQSESTYVQGEVIIQTKNDISYRTLKNIRIITHGNIQSIGQSINKSSSYTLIQSDSLSTTELLKTLEQQSEIISVQPNYIYEVQNTVTSGNQITPWGISTDGIQADTAHNNGFTGEDITVAIIDTGVDYTHEDLDANLWEAPHATCEVNSIVQNCPNHGWDFVNDDNNPQDDFGHGTHVAGTVAAEDNSIGVIGVAPKSKIMAIKVLSSNGFGTTADIAAGIDFARENGADIINMSIGATSYDAALHAAVQSASDAGVVLVAAAGNAAMNLGWYPAAFPEVISVGAIQQNSTQSNPDESMDTRLAYFSNYGNVDVVAPGMRINSTLCNCNGYNGTYSGDSWNGTSMASPHVAGTIALLLQAHPELNPAQVQHILETTAQNLGVAGRDQLFGSGLVDAKNVTSKLQDRIELNGNFTGYLPILPSDGESITHIQLTVMDNKGNFVANEPVTFKTTAGIFPNSQSTTLSTVTNASGIIDIELQASSTPGVATVTAKTKNHGSDTLRIEFTNIALITDTGEWSTLNSLTWWYNQAIADNHWSVLRYDTLRDHSTREQLPTNEYLEKFSSIIWAVGENNLPDTHQSLITEYLNQNGHLLLSGQDILYYTSLGSNADILPTTYLGISYGDDNGDTAITGDDLFTNIPINLVEYTVHGKGPIYSTILAPDYGTLNGAGKKLAHYTWSNTAIAGSQINANYETIFLPFSFETIELRSSRKDVLTQALYELGDFKIPTDAHILAGKNNSANTINNENLKNVAIDVTFNTQPTSGYAGIQLTDGSTTVTGYAEVNNSERTTRIKNIDVSTLHDGQITLSAAHTDNPINFPAYFSGTAATKDTSIPGKLQFSKIKAHTTKLQWRASSNSNPQYEISYGTDSLAENGGNLITTDTHAIVRQLKSNTKYFYKVRTIKSSQGSPIANQKTLPEQPKRVRIKKRGTHYTIIRWKGEAASYIITYGTNAKASNKGKINTRRKIRRLKQLESNTMYYFKIAAKNSSGKTRFTKIKTFRTK